MIRGAHAPIAIAIAMAVLSPAIPAWALCPNCLAQRQTLTPTLELLGLFLLVPFAVAAVAGWAVRRALYGRSVAAAPPSVAAPSVPPSSAGGDQGG
jgi:hypothetical protein